MKARHRFNILFGTQQHLTGKPQSTSPYLLDTASPSTISKTDSLLLSAWGRRHGSFRGLCDMAQVGSY